MTSDGSLPLSMPNAPRVTIGFRSRGYTDEDRVELVRRLELVATVELQPIRLPEAGGSAELWATIDFVGLAVASGIIGNLATDALKGVCQRLAAWWTESTSTRAIAPEVTSIRVVFGDLTITVVDETHDFSPDAYFMSGPGIALVPATVIAVLSHFPPEVLRSENIRSVRVGVAGAQSDAESPFAIARYWQLGIGAAEVTDLYDSWYGTIGRLPTRSLRSVSASAGSGP